RDEHSATEYERWLHEHEPTLPNGTFLVTGLGSFVHYGAHIDGFRLEWFKEPLGPEWKLVRQYNMLEFLPRPERATIWRLDRPDSARSVAHDVPEDISPLHDLDDPKALFAGGMARYDKNDYPGARVYFRKLLLGTSPEAENAAFFYPASFFRLSQWPRAKH